VHRISGSAFRPQHVALAPLRVSELIDASTGRRGRQVRVLTGPAESPHARS